MPMIPLPSTKKSVGKHGITGKMSSLKYRNSSSRPSIRCRCSSIGFELNVGRYSAGIISLCNTTLTSSRLIHSGTWLSPDTTRCTLRIKGIFFSIPLNRYFRVPQSLKRFSRIGVFVCFAYSACHTGSRPLTYVITISMCYSIVDFPNLRACFWGVCFHLLCDHSHSSGDSLIIASRRST